jgi:hypothetical protein
VETGAAESSIRDAEAGVEMRPTFLGHVHGNLLTTITTTSKVVRGRRRKKKRAVMGPGRGDLMQGMAKGPEDAMLCVERPHPTRGSVRKRSRREAVAFSPEEDCRRWVASAPGSGSRRRSSKEAVPTPASLRTTVTTMLVTESESGTQKTS